MSSFRFRPKLLPAIGTGCLLALFIHLGLWQAGKGERAQAAKAQHAARAQLGPTAVTSALVTAEDVQDAPLTVTGTFDADASFFVDNRQLDGKPGLHVVTPLRIAGSHTRILVNRGWIGWGSSRAQLPKVETPGGSVTVSGIAAVPSTKGFFLMPDRPEAWPELWPRLDLQRYTQQSSHPVQPVVLLQTSESGGTPLIQKWPPPEDRVAMHQSYAMQWFGMALALSVFFVVASTRCQAKA
ncbi:MAG TPA: SURF1 family protein [Burkholderiaceae bacterium]|nr:SURF1 family protein [Burkholderiaceae bacterium]